MASWWPFLRLAGAVLAVAAIVRQLSLAVGNARAATTPWGSDVAAVVANFFSYFTILSNLWAVVALTAGAVWALRTRREAGPEPAWLATLFACASTYMLVTGIVYNLLLRSIPIAGLSDVWTNETLHVVIPALMLLDVILAPRRRPLPWRSVLTVVVFPILWVVYTLVRANFVTAPLTGNPWWYPYPFLDPHLQGGYLAVIGYIVAIAVVIVGIGALVVWVGRRRAVPAANGPTATIPA